MRYWSGVHDLTRQQVQGIFHRPGGVVGRRDCRSGCMMSPVIHMEFVHEPEKPAVESWSTVKAAFD